MLINMIGFNLVWFGLVYWGNYFTPVALIVIAVHLLLLSNIKKEARLVLLITVIGGSVDSLLHFFHFFSFPDVIFTPFWLFVLWGSFACTLCHSLSFLNGSRYLQILIGGGLAPLSYFAAERLGAVNIAPSLMSSYLVMAFIWSTLFIVFFSLKSILISTRTSYV